MSGRIGKTQREILRKLKRGWVLVQNDSSTFVISRDGGYRLPAPGRSCLALWERGYIMQDGDTFALTEQGKAAL
jgi:hypothetical protein